VATTLIESALIKPASVDRENGIIRGVRLLGEKAESKGRTYDLAGMRRAVPLYEGRPVNIDHGKAPRDLKSRFGRIENAKFDEAQRAIVGDIRYNRKHALAEQIAEAADKLPDTLGMSHMAEGKVTRSAGREIVTDILEVRSVDLVSDPATNKSLYESESPTEPGAKKMNLAEARIENPALVEALTKEIKAELSETSEVETLKTKLAEATSALDTANAKAAKAERASLVESKIAAAKLPAYLVTDLFRASLVEAKDAAAIDALVEDRKAIAKAAGPGTRPASTVQAVSESKVSDGTKSLIESDAKETAKAFGF